MKKLLIIFLSTCIFSSCYAQQVIKAGIYKIEHKRFQVTDRDFKSYDGRNIIGIGDPDYIYQNNPSPPPLVKDPYPMQTKDFHFDVFALRNIIFGVLKPKLKSLNINKENLSFLFSISQNGTVLNINYGLNKNTFITLTDIAMIDKKVKAEIKFSFTGIDYLQYGIISYSPKPIIF